MKKPRLRPWSTWKSTTQPYQRGNAWLARLWSWWTGRRVWLGLGCTHRRLSGWVLWSCTRSEVVGRPVAAMLASLSNFALVLGMDQRFHNPVNLIWGYEHPFISYLLGLCGLGGHTRLLICFDTYSSPRLEQSRYPCFCPKALGGYWLVYQRGDEGRVDLLLDRVEECVVDLISEMLEWFDKFRANKWRLSSAKESMYTSLGWGMWVVQWAFWHRRSYLKICVYKYK